MDMLIMEAAQLEIELKYILLYTNNRDYSDWGTAVEQLFFPGTITSGLEFNDLTKFGTDIVKVAMKKLLIFMEKMYVVLKDWFMQIFNFDGILKRQVDNMALSVSTRYSRMSMSEKKEFNNRLYGSSISRMLTCVDFCDVIDTFGEVSIQLINAISSSIQNQISNIDGDKINTDTIYPWLTNSFRTNLGLIGIHLNQNTRVQYLSVFAKRPEENMYVLQLDTLDKIMKVVNTYSNTFNKYEGTKRLLGELDKMNLTLKTKFRQIDAVADMRKEKVQNNIAYVQQQIKLLITIVKMLREVNVTLNYRRKTLIEKCKQIINVMYPKPQN